MPRWPLFITGVELRQYAQFRFQRKRGIHIPFILPAPLERDPGGLQQRIQVYALTGQKIQVFIRKVLAHGRHQIDVRKKPGGHGKMDGGTAQHIIAQSVRRPDRIQSYCSQNQYAHLRKISVAAAAKRQ